MSARALLVLLALLAAGCVSAVRDSPVSPASVIDASGLRVSLHAVAPSGGEPTIGATRNGDLYVAGATPSGDPASTVDERIFQSKDQGTTWKQVGDTIHDAKADADPWMWADPRTDRVYNAPNNLACSWLEWSDDGGKTWDFNPVGGCGLPGNDHQKMSGGPAPKGVATQGYPDILYYAYNSIRPALPPDPAMIQGGAPYEGTVVDVSYDGGKTWTLPVLAHPEDKCHAGINGQVAVAGDGTAYLPEATCKGIDVEVSKDGGKTWGKPVSIDGAGSLATLALDPAVAVDEAGNAYLAFPGKDGAAYLSVSRDNGTTWSAPVKASPPGVNETVHVVLVAGAAGRVALAYYGTDSDPRTWPSMDPSDAPASAVWHLYVGESVDALDAAPAFATARATPQDDPAQRGCIWLQGGVNDCRNVGDFIGMVQVAGRPYVVYVDGCDKCQDAASSHGSAVFVARLDAGPSLLEGALPPLTAAR